MSEPKSLPGITRQDEEERLASVLTIAQKNLVNAQNTVASLTGDLKAFQEEFDQRDKETQVLWNNAVAGLKEARENLLRCEKARKKPYFGRIDFLDQKLKKEEAYYVGRVGIRDAATDRVVIDWRAPIATVYYENSLGTCTYHVKNVGDYTIDLTRKRTYEIADDKLLDYYDSEVVANDDLLTKYLAKSKKAVLGEIIATIQKEQNFIIRKSPRNNILVQGVAGSGKTTVAMHRISYILYNYGTEFQPKDFYIVGSNRILLNYITSVLPDLDVYGVSQMTMEQLFVRLLYEDWDAKKYSIRSIPKGDKEACIKGSYQWFHDLEAFCLNYEWKNIPHEDAITEKTNKLLLAREEIATYIKDNPQVSMQEKILMLNERIKARLENEIQCKDISYSPEDKSEMKRFYRFYFGKKIWKGSIYELYQQFLEEQIEKDRQVIVPDNEFDVYDLAALAYLYKRIKEADPIREATHVVIDEAQDFGMMAYASLTYCLRSCTYTIMGDVSQNIHFGYGLNDWEELKSLILKDKFDTFGLLKKSYRNTVEISNFATGILRHGTFAVYPVEPIIRHGNPVQVQSCQNDKELLKEAVGMLKNWKSQSHETIAVVCRDEEESTRVSHLLEPYMELADSDLETAEFGSGIMVLPVEYTKGLEFDAVLLWNPSNEAYPVDDGHVKLLYVAATRALHELAVLHTDILTELIATEVQEEKIMESLTIEENAQEEKKQTERKEPVRVLSRVGKRKIDERDILAGEERRTGPKRIVVQGNKNPDLKALDAGKIMIQDNQEINASMYRFGDVPEAAKLHPAGHGRIDTSVKFLRKKKDAVEIASPYGLLRIAPVTERVIRITFIKGQLGTFDLSDDFIHTQPIPNWACKETKDAIGIATKELLIQIEKKNGIVKFFTRSGKLILAERDKDARQIDEIHNQVFSFFHWKKSEKIWAKGFAKEERMAMDMKARYISYDNCGKDGRKKMRMPYVISDNGYGLAFATKNTVMCCNIPMYGTYVMVEDTRQMDYYFMYGGSGGASIELYQMLKRE